MRKHTTAIAALPAMLLFGLVSLPVLGSGALGALPTSVAGIPERALEAYTAADRWCDGLRWELVAAIGFVESGHGTSGGATIDEDGIADPSIFGPPLDGSPGVLSLPIGPWLDWWGLVGPWQQAVGPMQFLPGTFEAWKIDGDEDGTSNPHDIDDAVVTAANYLCGGPDGAIVEERSVLLRYNNSSEYATKVLAYAEALAFGGVAIDGLVCPIAGPVSFVDTWGAPRSGGRSHKGVDMFAALGTPVVAPVAGLAERSENELGGLTFRLWGDDGNFYYGAHLSAYGAFSGDVSAGTILGYVGTSGNAAGTPPHLHFEIHPGRGRGDASGPVNPTPAVAASCEAFRLGYGISRSR